jgi:hypothetical protein
MRKGDATILRVSEKTIVDALKEADSLLNGGSVPSFLPSFEAVQQLKTGIESGNFQFNVPRPGSRKAALYSAIILMAITNCRSRSEREQTGRLWLKAMRVALS